MKNLLSINQTAATGKPDGAAFITHQTSPEMLRQIKAVHQEGTELREAGMPLWLGFVRWGAFLGAALLSGNVLRQAVSIPEFLEQSPVLFWLDVVLLLVFALSFPAVRILRKRHMQNVIRTAEDAMRSLAVQPDAKRMDLLCYTYTEENGAEQRESVWMNRVFQVYLRQDRLCISDLLFTLEIPLRSLQTVRPSGETASFRGWTKQEPPAQYGVKGQNGLYFVQYSIAEIRDERGNFCLMLPDYEIQAFCELIGLSYQPSSG